MISRIIKITSTPLFILALLVGCSKEKAPATASEDYSPLTANSTWTYKTNSGSTFVITATNRDTVAKGKTYKVLLNSAGQNLYQSKAGGEYFRFGTFADVGINAVEELYLKDNQPVNATWLISQAFSAPGIPIPLTANLNYTIKEKGINKTVGSKSFTNVIHIRLDLSIAGFGSIGGGDFYYANGVGLIENIINVTVPGQAAFSQTQQITDYSIK